MKLAIATVCLSGTLDEKLEAIAAAGFTAVEVFENDLLSYGGTPAEVRRRAADLGLAIVVYQPFRDFEGLPEPARTRALARAERKFDTMAELGCDLLMVCSSVSPDGMGGLDRAADDFRALGERAAARGMRVAYEALAWGRHVGDYRDAWEIVRRADHPAVGFVLDSFHVLARGTDLRAIRAIPREKIFLVQMADAPRLQMDLLSWSRHHRSFPGQGELPIADFMDALGATGFDGLLSLEIFSDRFRAGSARGVAVDGHRSLIATLDELARRRGEATALPPRARCRGVEFIEFALEDDAAPGFEAALAGLGFARAARHRSKDVERWSQGGINLVVNRDKEGFAHSFAVTHGSGICAIALKVDDADAAAARALGLLDQPFRQAVGPGELDIPAVRGVGGGLLYFVDAKGGLDRLWDVDFEALPAATSGPGAGPGAGQGAGLTGVDHLSQSMRDEEMLTWLLFYTSLLDLAKTPAQSVVDPGGVVQSQVVEAADGAVRLVLNASQSRRTLASRFLAEAFGAGVQHVALATDDIFATVERLRAAGVALLPIPENYYDDLESRADLAPDEIERLREGNVLYDREGEAAYFQVYTRALLEGGFFLEIVERRAYRGFGAVNAPIRLAAQTRLAPHPAMPRIHGEPA